MELNIEVKHTAIGKRNAEFIARAVKNQSRIDESVEAWEKQKESAHPGYTMLPTGSLEEVLIATGATDAFINHLTRAVNSHSDLLKLGKAYLDLLRRTTGEGVSFQHIEDVIAKAEGATV